MSWAEVEFGEAELGDVRRTRRLTQIAEARGERPDASLPQCFQSVADLKGGYDFYENDEISHEEILASHVAATTRRVAQERGFVLAIQDTMLADFTSHPATTGLGVLNDINHFGMLVHTTLAVTPERVALGLVTQQIIYRNPAEFGKSERRRKRPVDEKESGKWLVSLRATAAMQRSCPECRLVNVGDREADVYDLILLSQQKQQEILVRAALNRRVEHEAKYLWPAVESLPPSGVLEVAVPRHGQQKARTAHLTVRYTPLLLYPPRYRAKEKLPKLEVYLILAREEHPPAGLPGIEWLLLTTVKTCSFEEACTRVEWYACRWVIEIYHKVLKSGCHLEERQFEHAPNIERYLAVDSVVAWRVLGLTFQSREKPNISCEAFLEPDEWKALFNFTKRTRLYPTSPPTLKQAALWIAKLGGFLGRKSDGNPGVTVMWRGLERLADIVICWQVINHEK